MRDTDYLTFHRGGVSGMRKRKPALKAGEYAVQVKLAVADRFFDRAVPVASLEIDERHITEPEVDVDMQEVAS